MAASDPFEGWHCQVDDGESESCDGCRVKCNIRVIPLELSDLIDRLQAESESELPPEREHNPNRLELVEAVGMLTSMLEIHYLELERNPITPGGSPRDYLNERKKLEEFMATLKDRLELYFQGAA